MRKFVFYDTDINGKEDYDIAGDDYAKLISVCCKYSAYLSLRITDCGLPCVKELEKYRVEKDKKFVYMYAHFYKEGSAKSDSEVRYYSVCPELMDLLLRVSDNIFGWINGQGYANPEDPVFYRADGSVFFSSVIHDGQCVLYPNDDEDVSEIVSKDNWSVMKEQR